MSDMAPILLYYAFKAMTPFVDALVNERLRQLLPRTTNCLLASLYCIVQQDGGHVVVKKFAISSPDEFL